MAEIIAFPSCTDASDKKRDRDMIPTRSAEILFFLGVRYVRDAEAGDHVSTVGTTDTSPAKPAPAARRRTRKRA